MRGANFRDVVLDWASSLCQHGKHGLDALLGCALDLGVVDWLHHAGIGCEEGGVEGSAGGGDYLAWGTL